jgi:hypothetical protein
VAGGSALPPDGWALPPALEDVAVGPSGTADAGAESGGSTRTTACHWGRRAVVTRRILIGLFELKFDCLN